jgi:hypothetical protein
MSVALTEREFSRHVNTKFYVRVNDQKFELELVQVRGYVARDNEQPGLERFSVVFKGSNFNLPQQICSLEHEEMGTFDIFLVPIARDGETFSYEAVFNYNKDAASDG